MTDDPGRRRSIRRTVIGVLAVAAVVAFFAFVAVPVVLDATGGNPAGLLLFAGLFALAVVVARVRYPNLFRAPDDRRRQR